MLTYKIRERILQFKDKLPQYPNNVILNVGLEPHVPFGGVAGPSRSAVKDQHMIAKANLSTGRLIFDSKAPLFDPLDSSIAISNITFKIKKNVASVHFRCKSEKMLIGLLGSLFFAFPAVLNVHILDAPFATHAWGSVGESNFQWLFEATQVRGSVTITSKKLQESKATNSWRQVATVATSRRLMGGLHYFHVACRLLGAGYNRFEFMSEALLNLSKVLQSLFGQTRDEIRDELRELGGYTDEEIDAKFITAMFLRNEFDVAHVSLSLLAPDQLKTLHKYTNIAEYAFRKLFEDLLEKIEKGEYELPPDTPPVLHKDKRKILEKIKKNLRTYD